MAMRDALIDAYTPESIDRDRNQRITELLVSGAIDHVTAVRLLNGPPVKREPRRTMMTERQLLDVIDRAIAEFRHIEGTYDGVDWMQLDREHDVASFALIRVGRPIRDPGPSVYICKCGWPLERFFGQTLPCATCSDRNDATVLVDPGRTPENYYLSFRVIFHRDQEARRWKPQPCINRYVDSKLTEMLEDCGLGRALMPIEPVRPLPVPPEWTKHRSFVEQVRDDAIDAITYAFAHVPVGAGRKIGPMEHHRQIEPPRAWIEEPILGSNLVEVVGAHRDFKHQFTSSKGYSEPLRGHQSCSHCGDVVVSDPDAVEDCWKRVRMAALWTCRTVEVSHDRKTWTRLDGVPTRDMPWRYVRLGPPEEAVADSQTVPCPMLPWPDVVPGMEFRHKGTGRIAKTVSPRQHKDRKGAWDTTDGIWLVGDPKEAHNFEFIDTDPRWEPTPENYAWLCTQGPNADCHNAATHALFSREPKTGQIIGGAGACDMCWAAGKRAPLQNQMSFDSPEWTVNREAQHQREMAAARASAAKVAAELEAAKKRAEETAKAAEPVGPVALCGLGLTCQIHHPPKAPEPYVPTVTEWDLLPDVVPDAVRIRR